MAMGSHHTDPTTRLIAAALTRQEWLADRRSGAVRWLGRLPGCAWLLVSWGVVVRPARLRAACRRAQCHDAHALVRQLLVQGNRLGHLFHWTPSQLSDKRLSQDLEGMRWLIEEGADQERPNPEKLSQALVARLHSTLSHEARRLLESLRESVVQAAQEQLSPLTTAQMLGPRQRLALARAAQDLHDCVARLCQRLAHDRQRIHQCFGLDLTHDPPTSLVMGCGDRHRDGDSTTLIELSSGQTLLYKPRDMALEQAIGQLLEADTIPRILLGQGYGYQQPVKAGIPDVAVGRQLGRLIASLDVLGAVDLHQDNLIIGSDQVWLVDGEAVLHRRVPRQHPIGDEPPPLGDSVLALGVVAPPLKTAVAGSSFCLTRHGLSKLLQNSAEQDEEPQQASLVPLSRIEQDLLAAYSDHLEHPNGAGGLPRSQLQRLKGLRRRVVMRNTRLYSTLLRQLWRQPDRRHADMVLDGLWDVFRRSPGHPQLVDLATAEALELARGHIPFFTTKTGSTSLDPIHGIRLPAHQHQPVLWDVRRRQRQRSCRTDQIWQTTLLRSALLLIRAPQLNQSPPQRGSLTQAIAMIEKHLAQTALSWRGQQLWLTLVSDDGSEAKYSLQRDLYQGAQGITLARHWLNRDQPTPRFRPRRWQRQQCENLDAAALAACNGDLLAWALHPPASPGRSSLPHAWTRVLRRIGRSLTLQRNKPGRSSESPKPSCDLISGLGGLIGSLQAARHRCSRQERTLLHHVQMQAAQVLLDLQRDDGSWDSPNPLTAGLTGWSHGTAGIAAALGAMETEAAAPMADQIRRAIARAIQFELNWLDSRGDWIDLRSVRLGRTQRPGIGQSWCHGAPGALLAAVILQRHGLDDIPEFEQWSQQALASTMRARPSVDGLCCGTSGLLLIQELAAQCFHAPEVACRAEELRQLLAIKVCDHRINLGDYFPLRYHPPGLFDGYGGVALALACRGTDLPVQTLLSYGLLPAPPAPAAPQP